MKNVTKPSRIQFRVVDLMRPELTKRFLLAILMLFCCVSYAGGREKRSIRVGIFQNKPIVFQDEQGQAKGLYVDVLNAIAEKENWNIQYVLDTWNGCLERLRKGDIDLMTCIAYNEGRDIYADWSHEVVWTLWGVVFAHPDSGIEDITFLNNKKVAILKGGINGINFKKLCREFGITCKIIELSSHHEELKAVESGQVDAAVVNSVFGTIHGDEYRIKQTSIIFSPVNAFFAASEGKDSELLATIDSYLKRWKKDKDSVYNCSLRKWLMTESEPVPVIPTWLLVLFLILTFGALILLVWTKLLRRIANLKTTALQESEERFRMIAENAPVLINSFDEDGRCLFWDKQCSKTFGWTIEEINEHESAMALFYPDPAVFEEVIRSVTTDPDGSFREWHPVTKDGKILSIMWANFRLPNGQVFSMGYDITERKQSEQALKGSEDKLNLIINASPIGICTVDPLGNFSMTNLAYERMVGYSKEELKSLSFFDVTHPNDRPKNKKLFQSMFSLKATGFSMKKRYIRKDGSNIDVAVHAIGIMDAEGNVRFGTAFVDDITEQKKLNEELTKHREHLEELVEEKTKDLRKMVNLMAGREIRMKELKDEIEALKNPPPRRWG
jgi:PAS domain S-box-containing protein